MINKLYLNAIGFLLLTMTSASVFAQEHYAHATITKTSTNKSITYFANPSSSQEVESRLDWSTHDLDNAYEFRLYDIPVTESFSFEFSVESKSGNDVRIGIRDGSSNLHEIKFASNATLIVGGTGYSLSYTISDVFKIDKCGNDLNFYKNNSLIAGESLGLGAVIGYEAFINVLAANTIDLYFDFQEDSDCVPTEPSLDETASFNLIDQHIKNNCAILPSDGILRFSYQEKYNIVPGENDVIYASIYDYTHELIMKIPMSNSYGYNHKSIDINTIPGGLPSNTNSCYQLEVEGANKGLDYFLNFRTK